MKTSEKDGFRSYVFVAADGTVTVLEKRDIGASTQDRIYYSSSVIAVFNDGGIEVVKDRKKRAA